MKFLFCALSFDQYNKFFAYKITYEIWYALEVVNEGTNQVKEIKTYY
jgi:hypothetical protein